MAQNRKYKDFTYKEGTTDVPIRVESAIRDGNGVRIDTNYAKFSDVPPGFTTLEYETADFTGTTPSTYSFYQSFPYMATVTVAGVTGDTCAYVAFSQDQVESGNFASVGDTGTNAVYLFSKSRLEGVQIPTIIIGFDFTNTDPSQQPPIRSDIVSRTVTKVTGSTGVDGYSYVYSFAVNGVTATRSGVISFGEAEATSGDWAQVADTGGGEVRVYSRIDKGSSVAINIGYVII